MAGAPGAGENRSARDEADLRARAVLDTVADGIITIDAVGTIDSFNRAAEAIFGYRAEEVIGENVSMLMPDPYTGEHDDYLRSYRDTREAKIIGTGRVVRGLRKGGTTFPMELAVGGTQLPGREVFTGIVRDISQRVKAEQDLRDTEERLRAIVETAVDGIVVIDMDGSIESFNPAAERIFGYSFAEVRGRNVSMLMPDPYHSEHDQYLRNYLTTGDAKIIGIGRQVQGLRKNGHRFPMDLSVGETRVNDRLLFTGIVRDLTERHAQEQIFERLFNLVPDMLAIAGLDGAIRRANPAFGHILGFTTGELQGRLVADLVHPDDREETANVFRSFSHGERTVDFVNRVAGRDGSYLVVSWSAVPSLEEGLVYAAGRDITGSRAAAEEREKNLALSASNLAKTEFLSRMSHELRTPLNVVLGFAQVLQFDPLTPTQTESVGHILKAGKHLLGLIDEVLDITRVESGGISLSIEPIHFADVLRETMELMGNLAAQSEVRFAAEDGADEYLLADRQRLIQVLLNLVGNGVKYNRKGGKLTIGCHATEAGTVRIEVKDTGRGIAPAYMARLFTPFDRIGAEASDVEGTGLGLALSKRLVESMNGSISVESTLGVGSTFTVELPRANGPASEFERIETGTPSVDVIATGREMTIVYIEDNLANIAVVEAILARMPANRLLPAMQGRLGIELAVAHRPDLILLDLQLPDIGGEEVLLDLKTRPETASIPVIIVSASVSRGWEERLLAAGAESVLGKPLDVSEFAAAIERARP